MVLSRFPLATAVVALLAVAGPTAVHAQQAVRILCGFPPGGSADFFARLLADELTRETGLPHAVDNRPGVGGALAAEQLKTAPKDGNTLLVTPDTAVVVYPATVKRPRYQPSRDFVPVAMAGTYNLALSVAADSPYPDFASVVAAAKARPEEMSYGSPGIGSLPHLYGASLGAAAGIQWTHVSYKGAAPLMTDVIGDILPAMITPLVSVLPQVQSGKLKVLGTSDGKRSPRAPEVPTFAELGYPQLSVIGWFGVFVPTGVAPETVARLNATIRTVMGKPAVVERLASVDSDAPTLDTAAFARFVEQDGARWSKVIQDIDFTADNP